MKSAGSSGSSIGCVSSQTWSRMTSDGRRSSSGDSSRSRVQASSSRQRSATAHSAPPSVRTTFSSGTWANTPEQTRLVRTICMTTP